MTRILLSFLLLSVSAFGQKTIKESGNKTTTNEWQTFEQSGYSIKYPSTWELDQSGQMGSSFIIFSPLESDKDKFMENVNLLVQDLDGYNLDLNQYIEFSEEQIKTMLTNSTVIESKRVKDDKGVYHKIIYTADQGVFHFKFEQYCWVINDKAFVLTFTSEQDKFVEMAEIAEKILNTFILKI